MRKPYTPNDLRALAKQSGPQWDSEVRTALLFAADLLDAADLAVKSTQPPQAAPRVPMTEEELAELAEKVSDYDDLAAFIFMARSIEAHHGIVGVKP